MADYYVSSLNGNDSYDGLAVSYDGVHGPWKSLAHVARISFSPGDTIDGGNQTYREFVTLTLNGSALGGYITFKNFIVEGTVSFDEGYTYNGWSYENGHPWTNVSGEVWSKMCSQPLHAYYEDDSALTPVVTTSTGEAQAISRGSWTYYNSAVYYRASNGAAPSTHGLLISSVSNITAIGMLTFSSASWIHIKNVTVRRRIDDDLYSALTLYSCNNIIMEDCTAYHNGSGVRIKACSNVTATNLHVYQNIGFGLGIEGTGDNLSVQGIFSENGRMKYYYGTAYTYGGDGDNIGIGYDGGTVGTVTIHDSIIEKAGPGPESAAYNGSGIFLGTAYPMTVAMLNIYNNIVRDSHATGIRLGNQLLGFKVYDNIITNNCNNGIGFGALSVSTTGDSFTGGLIANNVFYHCIYGQGIYLNPLIASGTYIDIKNNIFCDNGGTVFWGADIFYQNPDVRKIREANNLFWRSAGSWGTDKVICNNVVFYDLNHVVGSSAGYWQHDATSSQNNVVDDPLIIDPDNGNFRLDTGSPAIAAGTNVNLSSDNQGNAWRTNPSIGALEYYKISGVISPETIGGKHYNVT